MVRKFKAYSKATFYQLLVLSFISFISLIALYLSWIHFHKTEDVLNKNLKRLYIEQKNVTYYDEVLTMSARMAALNNLEDWKKRYEENATKLDASLAYLLLSVGAEDKKKMIDSTNAANDELIKMESKAFELIHQKKPKEALDLLFSRDYVKFKKIYNLGMTDFLNSLEIQQVKIKENLKYTEMRMNFIFIFLGGIIFILSFLSVFLANKNSKILNSQIDIGELELTVEKELTARAAKLASIGEIAATIAHDIANPLMIIKASSEKLIKLEKENQITDNNIVKNEAARINKTAYRITRIIKNVQYLTQGNDQDQIEELSLIEVYNESIDILHDKATNKNVAFAPLIENTFFHGRKTQMIQLIVNLMSNAIDAVEHLEERKVWLEFKQSHNLFILDVCDSGPGIPDDLVNKLFDPLFTTKESGKGTGLGLVISQRIVENHQGKIYPLKKDGHTCFRLEFPKIIAN